VICSCSLPARGASGRALNLRPGDDPSLSVIEGAYCTADGRQARTAVQLAARHLTELGDCRSRQEDLAQAARAGEAYGSEIHLRTSADGTDSVWALDLSLPLRLALALACSLS
jgi:hypothetical protein